MVVLSRRLRARLLYVTYGVWQRYRDSRGSVITARSRWERVGGVHDAYCLICCTRHMSLNDTATLRGWLPAADATDKKISDMTNLNSFKITGYNLYRLADCGKNQ